MLCYLTKLTNKITIKYLHYVTDNPVNMKENNLRYDRRKESQGECVCPAECLTGAKGVRSGGSAVAVIDQTYLGDSSSWYISGKVPVV